MEAARTSETLVQLYQTTRCYNPEDSHLHTHRRENLKSYQVMMCLRINLWILSKHVVRRTDKNHNETSGLLILIAVQTSYKSVTSAQCNGDYGFIYKLNLLKSTKN
jgi:hypothetical protein